VAEVNPQVVAAVEPAQQEDQVLLQQADQVDLE
jgi:hypothetical protein